MMSTPDALVGLQIHPKRPGITIAQVREADHGLLLAIRWDEEPQQLPVTTWLCCTEREPEMVRRLVHEWLFFGDREDPRISDAEPPGDVPCGGWLAPDGRLWRCSEITHRLNAKRIIRQLHLPVGHEDPERWLQAHGWLLIFESGSGADPGMTQAQRDTLFDLAMQFPTMQPAIMAELGKREEA
jgi:hypothetical protein